MRFVVAAAVAVMAVVFAPAAGASVKLTFDISITEKYVLYRSFADHDALIYEESLTPFTTHFTQSFTLDDLDYQTINATFPVAYLSKEHTSPTLVPSGGLAPELLAIMALAGDTFDVVGGGSNIQNTMFPHSDHVFEHQYVQALYAGSRGNPYRDPFVEIDDFATFGLDIGFSHGDLAPVYSQIELETPYELLNRLEGNAGLFNVALNVFAGGYRYVFDGEGGIYQEYDYLFREGYYGTATLAAISTTAVPEPTSWALMIAGFGLAGAAVRHRRAAASV